MSADGCLLDSCLILTRKEYHAKVLFDKELLRVHGGGSGGGLSLSLLHELMAAATEQDDLDSGLIAFSFGDILTYVPIFERAEWKDFYRGMQTISSLSSNYLDKLIFLDFKTTRESDAAMRDWQARLDKIK